MKKYLAIVFISLMWLACNSRDDRVHTFDEFESVFYDDLIPMGTWFWDEFGDMEAQYGLSEKESKLLGIWYNATYDTGPDNNRYAFFPNNFFMLQFKFQNFRVNDAEKMYFNKALGTWNIFDDIVRITIYAIITEDTTIRFPHNKGLLLVEQPYTIDFINIDDIDERGFTRRPINDTILSKELQQKVTVQERNKTNNLYVRNVYIIDVLTNSREQNKDYGYFDIVPELARENLSGLDIITNPELIRRYIPDWWY